MIIDNFIVFEGIDGSGTTTQLKLLEQKIPPHLASFSAEPTKKETGLFLRRLLKGEFAADPRTAAYLFAADRCEHIYGTGGILEASQQNKIAVTDRYLFSSLAYQSASCGSSLPQMLNSAFPLPSILFYFKIEPEKALTRVDSRGTREIYEELSFLKKTAAEYEHVISSYASEPGMKTIILDASQSIEKIEAVIWSVVKNLPILSM